jgi:hypothetical protein
LTQQTGAVVADLDRDEVNDLVLSFPRKPPALVWYRRKRGGWERFVIESDLLTIEAGGRGARRRRRPGSPGEALDLGGHRVDGWLNQGR